MKRIILCADDYGQNPAISQAIIDLLEKKRLSATSCMTTSADWLEHAPALEPFKNQADIGLHFNLTEHTPLSRPVAELMLWSHCRLLRKKTLVAEYHAQLDLFEQGTGRLPDFVDGHQHVHQFPVIRDALLTVYEDRLRENNSYIRCTYNANRPLRWNEPGFLKEWIINLSGAREFKRILVESHIPHNNSFSGIYDFAKTSEYAAIFPRFVEQVEDGGLIMCHPGLANNSPDWDTIVESRMLEYQYFLSGQVPGIRVVKFGNID